MAVTTDSGAADKPSASGILATAAYRVLGYFGLMSVIASLAWGFRHSAEASWWNVGLDVLLYGVFIAPHLLLTQREVKQAVFGHLAGTLRERQLYILLTTATWLLVLWLHLPVPGPELALWAPLRFAGLVGYLWTVLLFFEGATREQLDGLLGVPGSEMQYSHGSETPLRTDGQYAQVRHPMYRAVMLMGVAALVYHPNAGQLLWTIMLGLSFVLFIPLEEKQLLEARGDEYRRYCQQTPWRLFRGIW